MAISPKHARDIARIFEQIILQRMREAAEHDAATLKLLTAKNKPYTTKAGKRGRE